MAFRTWGRLLLTALGVSVLAGAGQLGVAYGFGIVRLTGDFTDVNRWPAQLAWAGWFAVTAAVAGAVLTGRLARREGLADRTGAQLAISAAAALGALVVAPLCMQPARAAELSTIDPVWAVGICAVVGAVVGAGAASAVLLRPPLGWNVALLAGVIWLLALISVAPTLLSTGPLRTVRLGVLEPGWLGTGTAQRLAMVVLPVLALVVGAVTGAVARRRGHVPLIAAGSGAAGPVLLAFAYLTAGPGDPVDRYQLAPYYGAVIAVGAGALGSVTAALLRWPPLPRRAAADAAIEPSDILAPLPAVPAPATSAGPAATSTAATAVVPGAAPDGVSGRTVPVGAATDAPTPAHWEWPGVTPDATGARGAPDRTADASTRGAVSTDPGRAAPVPPGAHPTGPVEVRPVGGTPAAAPTGTGTGTPAAPVTGSARPDPSDAPRSGRGAGAPVTGTGDGVDALPGTRPADAAAVVDDATGRSADAADASSAGTGDPVATGGEPAGDDGTGTTGGEPAGGDGTGTTGGAAVGAEPATAPRPRVKRPRKPRATTTDGDAPTGTDEVGGDAAAPATGTAAAPGGKAAAPRTARPRRSPDRATPAPTAPAAAAADTPGTPAAAQTAPGTPPGNPTAAQAAPGTPPAGPGAGQDGPGARQQPGPAAGLIAARSAAGTPPAPGTAPAGADAGPPAEQPAPTRPTPLAAAAAAPRPRHRLPDLTGGDGPRPADPPHAALPFPDAGAGDDETRPGPVSLRWDAPGAGTADGGAGAATGTPAGEPDRRKPRRGLFRRNRTAETTEADAARPLAAHDEEYVDWVAGLSRPLADNEPERESGRRSLRSSGRHHRE